MRHSTVKGVGRARSLRRRLTDAERLLWYRIKDRRLIGLKFRRQHPVGNYIADFVCLEHKVVVEVDGGQHGSPLDEARDAALGDAGFRVLRFWNNQVISEMDGVLQAIASAANTPHPTLSPHAGRGEGSPRLKASTGK